MPRISSFYGITIWMYYDEIPHRGRPHFHATYGEAEASIDIDSRAIIAGWLPPRARRLVTEWATTNQAALRDNWERARAHRPAEVAHYHQIMRSTPLLLDAKPSNGYAVVVRFGDGLTAEVDLSYLLDFGGVFEPLRDIGISDGSRLTLKPERLFGPTRQISRPRRFTRRPGSILFPLLPSQALFSFSASA